MRQTPDFSTAARTLLAGNIGYLELVPGIKAFPAKRPSDLFPFVLQCETQVSAWVDAANTAARLADQVNGVYTEEEKAQSSDGTRFTGQCTNQ